MQAQLINAAAVPEAAISNFGALNRTDKGNDNEFLDMVNMSSGHYPCLSPREPRKKLGWNVDGDIRAVIAPRYSEAEEELSSFTGVAGTTFYDKDSPIDGMAIPADGQVTLADFNGVIIILVYGGEKNVMYCYDYTASNGKICRMEKGVYGSDGGGIIARGYSEGDPEADSSVINYIEYISGEDIGFDWGEHFTAGDSFFIEGFPDEENNTVNIDSRFESTDAKRALSCVVDKTDGNKLYFQMYNNLGARLVLKTDDEGYTEDAKIKVYTKLPEMNSICVHNNRLWGTNPNGEYVYASKLGDCFNFNCFAGLANDSYYSEIGTPGDFVGIVSYRDNLVAFKRDYIHHIYGDKPSNFTIPKQLIDCGCIDIRSAAQIETALYFLGYNGFYRYTGGQPQIISSDLNCAYKSAVAASDGIRYMVSAQRRDNGVTEVLVFDTRYGLWYKEDDKKIIGSFRWHNDLYIATEHEGYKCRGGLEKVDWSVTSVIMYDAVFDNKNINELWIRAKLDEGAELTVRTSCDGGEWIRHETLLPCGLKVYRVPVRMRYSEYYQYRLEGKGGAVIYDIERKLPTGGRAYKKEW